MNIKDPSTRLYDSFAEVFADLGDAAVDEKALTAEEAAELVLNALDEWLLYNGTRYTFYCSLKNALQQRLCKA